MKTIPLTQGKVTIVDDEDYDVVSKYKWWVVNNHSFWYAVRKNKNTCGKWRINSLHRFILQPKQNETIDHINHDTLDNRRQNLRICTHSQNCMNAKKTKRVTTSKFKGVSWDKECNKFRTLIRINRKLIGLGRFVKEIDAAKTYNVAAIKYFGEFAVLNIIKE